MLDHTATPLRTADEARRDNAQLSTGPQTEAGKQRSKFNARRHNLSGQTIVGSDEEMRNYYKCAADLKSDMRPVGTLETSLVQSIADAQWQLDRARAAENNLLFESAGKHTDEADETRDFEVDWAKGLARSFSENAKQLDLLSRYANRFHRQVLQTHATLAKIQKERRQLEMQHNLERKRRNAEALANELHRQSALRDRRETQPNQINPYKTSFVSQANKLASPPAVEQQEKRTKTMKQIAMENIQARQNQAA